MPTPSDDTLPDSPPNAISVDPRNAHTCPPEEERDLPVPASDSTETAHETPTNSSDGDSPSSAAAGSDDSALDVAAPGNIERTDTPRSKHMDAVEEALMRDDIASSSTSEESKESDLRLAHSMSAAAISPSSASSQFAFSSSTPRVSSTYPTDKHDAGWLTRVQFLPNSSSSLLRPGSKFHGTQQSDRQTYDVQVELKQVDMENSYLCGYLRIQGLTDDHPTLTTCFEGEIIGTKHTFRTAHPEWGSTEKVDMAHWARFPAWRPLAKQARSPSFTFKNFAQHEHLFMRWKEYFLVPDHKVKSITGASFEGFYYICFNQCTGTVSGIYFHSRSEKYQQLELKHVEDRGCIGAMEFR